MKHLVKTSSLTAVYNNSSSLSMICSSVRVVASWDTQQRLTYNPNAPRNPKKDPIPSRSVNPNSFTPSPTVTLTAGTNKSIFDLLKRPNQVVAVKLDEDQSYMGYERWLPSPPKVEKPRSVYNATSLAYIGDCIYELYARRHFLFPPLHIEEYNERVMAVVRCEAQDVFLQKLLDDDYLSKEERDVLRWGKNIISSKTKTKRRAGGAVYNRASSLETLVGYLYLTNANRLDEVMLKLGFCMDSSSQLILEKQVVVIEDKI